MNLIINLLGFLHFTVVTNLIHFFIILFSAFVMAPITTEAVVKLVTLSTTFQKVVVIINV